MSENQTNNHILYYTRCGGGWENINYNHFIHEFLSNINETLEFPPPNISKNNVFANLMEFFELRVN
jgi:hypothetical protein